MTDIIAIINAQRKQRGFLAVAYLLERYSKNIILDPFSTLISENIDMGEGNIIYPNVIIEVKNGGRMGLGSGNVLFPGTLFLADQGEIRIGNNNEFGDGGLRLKENIAGASITIGDFGRYTNGAEIIGKCVVGSGSQILGQITVQNCTLGSGRVSRGAIPTYEEDF